MNTTIKVYHRNVYGVLRTYAADPDQALCLHELTRCATLEHRHRIALERLGFTFTTVPDPRSPWYSGANLAALTSPEAK